VWGDEYELTGYGRFVVPGGFEVRKDTWDAWSEYHIMYGLTELYKLTGEKCYFIAVEKAAELFLKKFYTGASRLADTGCLFANLAPIHIFAILYNYTGKKEYLEFALEAEKDISATGACDFTGNSLAGKEFYECPYPRWEYLHSIEAMAELYKATGNSKYLNVFTQIWRSIQKTDVHNTGAFSTFEQAMGTPYIYGETFLCLFC